MRVLVTASRDWTDDLRIYEALGSIRNRPLTVVHGGARGGDRIAGQWARDTDGVTEECHPVREDAWRLSKRAGHLRNQFMVDLGADLCLAFLLDDSPGTSGCIRMAVEADIPTIVDSVTSSPQSAVSAVRRFGR